eukprot:TRINITY_DN8227_c0_g1_i1.p2 TRINITY_DN8227_c0_g1~~TRINITY_DN8227_c0_g1_i1.p2  ORF type:complete len:243 (-),score=60.29 TRINITY_DN8227_c0_g1_i1:115-843(-)
MHFHRRRGGRPQKVSPTRLPPLGGQAAPAAAAENAASQEMLVSAFAAQEKGAAEAAAIDGGGQLRRRDRKPAQDEEDVPADELEERRASKESSRRRRKYEDEYTTSSGKVWIAKEVKGSAELEAKNEKAPAPKAPQATPTHQGSSAVAEQGSPATPLPCYSHRNDRHKQLRQIMLDFIDEQGGVVDGPRLAAELAPRYNQWIRPNSGRNDGSFRKWVSSADGVWVEKSGQNKWRVHTWGDTD